MPCLLRAQNRIPGLLFRICCQRANAALQLDDAPGALGLAQRAIDLDPERFEGLLIASNAAAAASDLATSKRYIDRALKIRPHDPSKRGASPHISELFQPKQPLAPPPEVARAPEYLLSQAETASIQGDRQKVAEIVRALLKDIHRSPEALIHLATWLLDDAIKQNVTGTTAETLPKPTGFYLEVVDTLRDDDPRAHRALSVRAGVRMLANRKHDSDADLARLRSLGVNDPELINNLATVRCASRERSSRGIGRTTTPNRPEHPCTPSPSCQGKLPRRTREAARRDFDAATLQSTTPHGPRSWRTWAEVVSTPARRFSPNRFSFDLEPALTRLPSHGSQGPLSASTRGHRRGRTAEQRRISDDPTAKVY